MHPLNQQLYGSIPHLNRSRVEKTDRYLSIGQARIATTKLRDKYDTVIIQEKLDGSCCGVARIDDKLIALTRSGNLCVESSFPHHHHFNTWMFEHYDKFYSILQNGERLVGEYLGLAHGTKYTLDGRDPWVAFDLMCGHIREPYDILHERVADSFCLPPLISYGPPREISWVQQECPTSRYGGEYVEGWIWRVERHCKVDFVCKFVEPWYVAGKYLPGYGGQDDIWNWQP